MMSKGVLIYDYADHSIRTPQGSLIATAPNLSVACTAFEGVVFNVRNLPENLTSDR